MKFAPSVGVLLLIACVPALAKAADSVMGFGLYRSTSSGWTWEPLPSVGLGTTSEGGHLTLRLPESALKNVTNKSRVAVVSGVLGTPPRVWFTLEKPFQVDPTVPSPWASNLIAGTALYEARLARRDGHLQIDLRFDSLPSLHSAWDLYLLIDTDGSDKTGFLGGDYLLQNVSLGTGEKPSSLSLHWPEIMPKIGTVGQTAELSMQVHNTHAQPMKGVVVRAEVPAAVKVENQSTLTPFDLRPFESRRIVWQLACAKAGEYRVRVEARVGEEWASAALWISFATKRDPRHEFQTATGNWLPFPPRPTLQAGNPAGLQPFQTFPSGQLKHNLFGITAHLPRSTNEEDPYEVAHIIDGDPATFWASRWSRMAIPHHPEWVEVDLGATTQATEVRFLPAWKNSGAPAALIVQTSGGGTKWDTVLDETDYPLQNVPTESPRRCGERTWQRIAFAARPVRHVRIEARRLNKGRTAFFCAPSDPFQFRVAEITVLDAAGQPIKPKAAKARASSVHTAWYNSPGAIKRTWPLMFDSGVKLNRIGQWGDKIDWATVEKVKGKYVIDPEVDQAINESIQGGIEIVMTLDYGNNLYQKIADPHAIDVGPTWQRSHPFLQCAPTTPEAVAAWAKYCAFMAQHFRGRVKYFEIWNEENGWFFDAWANNNSVAMVKKYGQALLAAAQAIRAVNPAAQIIFGGTAGMTLDFPQIALDEGAGSLIDVFAFHPYGHPMPEAAASHFLCAVKDKMEWQPRPPEIKDYEGEIAALRQLLNKYKPGISIWADEMNWFAPGEPAMPESGDGSELSQAKYLARLFSTNAALGCGAIWWSLYNTNGIQEWAVVRSWDLTPRAAFYASACVSTLLDDAVGTKDIAVDVVGESPADLTVKVYRSGTGSLTVGIWRAALCDDGCTPVPVSLRLPLKLKGPVQLVDPLYGFQQSAVMKGDGSGIVLADLLVGDWPLFVRLGGGH